MIFRVLVMDKTAAVRNVRLSFVTLADSPIEAAGKALRDLASQHPLKFAGECGKGDSKVSGFLSKDSNGNEIGIAVGPFEEAIV